MTRSTEADLARLPRAVRRVLAELMASAFFAIEAGGDVRRVRDPEAVRTLRRAVSALLANGGRTVAVPAPPRVARKLLADGPTGPAAALVVGFDPVGAIAYHAVWLARAPTKAELEALATNPPPLMRELLATPGLPAAGRA